MSVSGTWQAGFRSSDRFFLAISESRTLSCAAFLTCRKTSHISYDPSWRPPPLCPPPAATTPEEPPPQENSTELLAPTAPTRRRGRRRQASRQDIPSLGGDTNHPMSYWNNLIPLAAISLNCLLPWQPNPAISAYHGLTGAPFDFRAHPVSPAGTSILIHEA